ncbi:MAG: 1-(5-phosphoribosyl)-5-[(5-phosphoribosylamino)methylideneamino]imidazole-4-carboxamide isomerase [Clostridiales bacterium]|nr:1-(5-phosphoribosyl)-5-[(5-phosphoribosylamino)methylideneamino]imidazole-4-carboxamide isomerase [Clostridiales bacterium]
MNIFPAIDIYDGKAVRLLKGDYNKMTVYSDRPELFAAEFYNKGAKYLHVVDLEGAKTGETPNIKTVEKIVKESGLEVEIGGGIRSEEVIKSYLDIGVMRVILGTIAVTNRDFLVSAVSKYGDKIAVGVDILNGCVAIRGWTEKTELQCFDFFSDLQKIGVKTVICTDISKDGALKGTNLALYKELSERFSVDITASGGVTSLDDIRELKKLDLYGAILGKALYENKIDLSEAVNICKEG